MRIELGNINPVGLPAGTCCITLVVVPDTDTADEALRTITDRDGVWPNHGTDPAPAWVEADDEAFARRLAAFYDIPVGRPDDWEDGSGR